MYFKSKNKVKPQNAVLPDNNQIDQNQDDVMDEDIQLPDNIAHLADPLPESLDIEPLQPDHNDDPQGYNLRSRENIQRPSKYKDY